jgi:archaellum component FlaC
MNLYVKRSGVWVCLFTMALGTSACESGGRHYSNSGGGYSSASTGNSADMTDDEKLLREQSASFVQDNTVGGAATGAILGCVLGGVLGALLGGKAQAAALGCGAGAAAGGIAGGVDGYLKGKAAQTQANEVLMTRSVTADVEKQNAKLEAAVQTAQRVVDDDQKKLDQINAALAAKTISLDNARAQTADIRQNSAEIAKILDAARKSRDTFVDARNQLQGGSDTTALDAEINQLNGEIAQLETQLAQVNNSLNLTHLN